MTAKVVYKNPFNAIKWTGDNKEEIEAFDWQLEVFSNKLYIRYNTHRAEVQINEWVVRENYGKIGHYSQEKFEERFTIVAE